MTTPPTIRDALCLTTEQLNTSSSATLDAVVLLTAVCQTTQAALFTNQLQQLTNTQWKRLQQLTAERARGVPVAYLLGAKEFYNRTFTLTPATLVPRPATETIITHLINTLDRAFSGTFIDVGTGSGCIAITLAAEFPASTVYASDISTPALQVARQNAQQHAADVIFLTGSFWEPFIGLTNPPSPIYIIANLPYVRDSDYRGDIQHEPATALCSGHDGLDHYRELIATLPTLPFTPTCLALEIDPVQKTPLCTYGKTVLPTLTTNHITDLSGQDRYLIFSWE